MDHALAYEKRWGASVGPSSYLQYDQERNKGNYSLEFSYGIAGLTVGAAATVKKYFVHNGWRSFVGIGAWEIMGLSTNEFGFLTNLHLPFGVETQFDNDLYVGLAMAFDYQLFYLGILGTDFQGPGTTFPIPKPGIYFRIEY